MRTLAILILLLTLSAHAANEGGHGGGSIVCGNVDGSIRSAELLDLWENREAGDGRTFTPSADSRDDQLEAALVKFAEVAPWEVARMRRVLAGLRTTPVAEGRMLLPPRDTGLRTLRRMRNCSLQGVAEFDDATGVLTVDPEILAAFDETNRAALMFHEALYKVWRGTEVNAQDSNAVRKLTRWVFADQPLSLERPDADRGSALFDCVAGDRFRFLVVNKGSGLPLELHFTVFGGRPMIGRMVATVQYDPALTRAAEHMVGWLPDSHEDGRIAVLNLERRLRDGVRRIVVPAQDRENPSQYPGLPFHYTVAFRTRSDYEPAPAVSMWGGDYFTSDRHREVTRNHHLSIFSLSTWGAPNRWQAAVDCRRP